MVVIRVFNLSLTDIIKKSTNLAIGALTAIAISGQALAQEDSQSNVTPLQFESFQRGFKHEVPRLPRISDSGMVLIVSSLFYLYGHNLRWRREHKPGSDTWVTFYYLNEDNIPDMIVHQKNQSYTMVMFYDGDGTVNLDSDSIYRKGPDGSFYLIQYPTLDDIQ